VKTERCQKRQFDHITAYHVKIQGLPLVRSPLPVCAAAKQFLQVKQSYSLDKSFPAMRLEGTMERIMYAVIRAGGKQYRVAPGDVVRLKIAR